MSPLLAKELAYLRDLKARGHLTEYSAGELDLAEALAKEVTGVSVTGDRLVGSRMSADHYLELLAAVVLATPEWAHRPEGIKQVDAVRLFNLACSTYRRDPGEVLARVMLAWGGWVPEVEEP